MNVSNSAGTEKKTQTHIDHISEKGDASDLRHGLVHEPIAKKDARNKQDKLQHQPGWDFKTGQSKSEVVQQAKKDGQVDHFASLMDLCHLKTLRACDTSPHIERESRAPEKTTSKTTVDTEQYSRSREPQLRQWQWQDSWIQFPDSLARRVRPTTRYQLTRRCTCQQSQMIATAPTDGRNMYRKRGWKTHLSRHLPKQVLS